MLKNIILDFGGILLDLDFKTTDERFKQLYGIDFMERNYPPELEEIFIDYEIGQFDEETFLDRLQAFGRTKIVKKDLLDIWNSMLVRIPGYRLDYLLELRKNYKVFLLSNTNFSHIHWVQKYLKKNLGIDQFEKQFFDKVYYSHEIQMRKPNTDIYEYVLEDAHLVGQQSLFIDDTLENVLAAISAGIHSRQHNTSHDIVDKLPEYIKSIS
jgi:putative hydrolase of the HAD superfamily